ncbi:leucine-rich repeat-containing protein 28 isoform X2 [Frankliniella occidentalis]|uniref:Leucine-rich repeat-containing protein 28 isoform X2 n=1 Tax=Frankliniella occidentalis TaxID=133901 RepID=A0A6J1TUR2_FRAOC|nr:leucine-rich repeat-containing protein 28 isoform X2 [Frankliniella occidentalis]
MEELAAEIMEKHILHWNCRGFTDLPEELKTAGHQLQEIYLKWNCLVSLPSWITNFKNLTNLYLQYNQIENLPDELSQVSKLKVLDVSNNKIQVLPRGIGCLSHLTHLLASDNTLKFIRCEFQMLKLLQVLDLRNNSLQNLPEDILECQALEEIALDNNNLTMLPDNIVYLPLLENLSVCGNNLLYLPLQPFMSNPTFTFENNFNLNYISLWLGQQISFNNTREFNDNAWNLLGAQGCFDRESVPIMRHADIIVKEETSNIPLTLPLSLKNITTGPNNQPLVPSLLELALRVSYNLGHHQFIEKEESHCGSITYRLKRCIFNNPDYKSLPLVLQHRLKVGPVGLCYCCQGPVFTYGIIWVILKDYYCESSAVRQLSNVLSIAVFCSVLCSVSYSNWERQSDIQWKLEPRKLTWFCEKRQKN